MPLAGERIPGRVAASLAISTRILPDGRRASGRRRPGAATSSARRLINRLAGDEGSAVTRIGITGHSNLTVESAPWVADALRAELAAHASDGLVGVSCLARGADQLFARAVLELGGALEVVIPAADYRIRKVKPDNAAAFDELIGQATMVRTLPFGTSQPRFLPRRQRTHVVHRGADGGGVGRTARRRPWWHRRCGRACRSAWPAGDSGVAHRSCTRVASNDFGELRGCHAADEHGVRRVRAERVTWLPRHPLSVGRMCQGEICAGRRAACRSINTMMHC